MAASEHLSQQLRLFAPPKPVPKPQVTSTSPQTSDWFGGTREPEQLRIFMSANELKDQITTSFDLAPLSDNIGTRYEHMDELWGRKLSESKVSSAFGTHGAGVHASIKKEGYKDDEKIEVLLGSDSKRLRDGHHRVAAASEVEKEKGKVFFIPVDYDEDFLAQLAENEGENVNDYPGHYLP